MNTPTTVDLYVAALPETFSDTLYPKTRQRQIEQTANTTLRRQRYAVWKLLEYALLRSFSVPLDRVSLTCDERGKWSCDACCFSLSHSGNAVAVAVSDRPVGVDIERTDRSHDPALHRRLLSRREAAEYETLSAEQRPLFLIEKWTVKEASFKRDGATVFSPRNIENDGRIHTRHLTVGTTPLCCSVATADTCRIRLFTDIAL